MATRRRPADVGAEIGRKALADLLREEAIARRDRGLSLHDVGAAVGVSESWLSRTERGLAGDLGLVRLSSMLSVVGLTLSARAYPGGSPLRDEGHAGLLLRLRRELHPTLFWRVEVPFPLPGDLRACLCIGRSHLGLDAVPPPARSSSSARGCLVVGSARLARNLAWDVRFLASRGAGTQDRAQDARFSGDSVAQAPTRAPEASGRRRVAPGARICTERA